MTLPYKVVLLRLIFDSSEVTKEHTFPQGVVGVAGVMMTVSIIMQDVVWSGFQVSLDPCGPFY